MHAWLEGTNYKIYILIFIKAQYTLTNIFKYYSLGTALP